MTYWPDKSLWLWIYNEFLVKYLTLTAALTRKQNAPVPPPPFFFFFLFFPIVFLSVSVTLTLKALTLHTYKSGTSVLYGIFLPLKQLRPLVCSLVLSRLDYCNTLLSGCPQCLLDKHQNVQNAAARLVCKAKKSDRIQPILQSLHWLPVTHRIQYKISAICFNFVSGKSPQYLSDPIQSYTITRKLRSASYIRSFDIPRVNT